MQWLINEFKKFKEDTQRSLDEMIDKWAQGQLRDAEELKKLGGEIKAMKARMGKKTGEPASHDGS